jgi:methyl-accepting chemotaxis protein
MLVTFNASITKLQHHLWKNKLITFLNGGEAPAAVTHRQCAIGKWLYESGGMAQYQALSGMQAFEKRHAEYHSAIKRVIDLHIAGDSVRAWTSYESVKHMTDELLGMIDTLDDQIKASAITVTPESRVKAA